MLNAANAAATSQAGSRRISAHYQAREYYFLSRHMIAAAANFSLAGAQRASLRTIIIYAFL